MIQKNKQPVSHVHPKKTRTGISGFDEITDGGLPKNRPTIVCGNSGCGKTVMSMQFLVKGAMEYDEPGVFLSFEETYEELAVNMKFLHFDLEGLVKKKKIYIEHLEIDRRQNTEVGNYDLEGLFVRLEHAIAGIGARRIVLDSLDALFFGLDSAIIGHEIKRLFKWLKEKKITAIITSEFDSGFITTDGLENYVADCVIVMDNRVKEQTATRRLRILKMRGSVHGNNEYPFIIDKLGISVLPLISQLELQKVTANRITCGIKELDNMLDGKGYFQGSSILVSGSAGTGKTSLAASFVYAACKKKLRSLYCAFEESPSQIERNMLSIGLNLKPHAQSRVLRFYSSRPTLQNLELHLIAIKKIIEEFEPDIVVLDPVTNLMSEGINSEIRQFLAHFVDYLKGLNITSLYTAAITLETIKSNPSDEGISSMMDTWILVRDIEENGERNRSMYVLKSRGMSHSTQIREFVITGTGVEILPTFIGAAGILTGTAKLEHTLREEERQKVRDNTIRMENSEMDRKRKMLEDNITLLKAQLESEIQALAQTKVVNDLRENIRKKGKAEIIGLRNKIGSSSQKSKNRNK